MKLGPAAGREIEAALPEINKRSKGVDVLLTTEKSKFNGEDALYLKIVAKTKRAFGGIFGIGAKKGVAGSIWLCGKNPAHFNGSIKKDNIEREVVQCAKSARTYLRKAFRDSRLA